MPALTWIQKTEPKINYLAGLFRDYRKAAGMTSAMIAGEVDCSAENARCQMNKPAEQWNVGQLMRYCDVLGIPYEEAFEAVIKSRRPVDQTGKRQRK